MQDNKFHTALIIGAGAFGTSVSSILANNFKQVILKVRSEDVYKCLLDGENSVYLPGQKLPSNVRPALSWSEVDSLVSDKVELIVSALPTSAITGYLYENYDKLESLFSEGISFVSLSKGIDSATLELSDDLFLNFFPEYIDQLTFLSGPSFAQEIMDEQVTVVSLAGRSKRTLEKVLNMMETSYFKIFLSYDVKGVLLGGALKNILAIAAGIIKGLGFNHNTRAAMITRGIADMLHFGKVFNARPETFYGLSGMGDLILSTTGHLSRNKQFGLEITKGRSPKEIIESKRIVVEGYKTTEASHKLSERYDLNVNIFNGVYSVVFKEEDPKEVIKRLMSLPPRFEIK